MRRQADAPVAVLEAHADLAAGRLRWAERHPRRLDLEAKVAAYDRHLLGSSPEPLPLRRLRADLEHLSARLDENHPRIAELKEEIASAEQASRPGARP